MSCCLALAVVSIHFCATPSVTPHLAFWAGVTHARTRNEALPQDSVIRKNHFNGSIESSADEFSLSRAHLVLGFIQVTKTTLLTRRTSAGW